MWIWIFSSHCPPVFRVTWFFRSLICWFYQTFEQLCIKYFVNVTHLHSNQSFHIGFIFCSKHQNLLMSSHSSCGSFLLSVASTCRPTSSKMTGRDSRFIMSMDFSCVLALSSSICTSQRFQVMNKFTMSQVTFIYIMLYIIQIVSKQLYSIEQENRVNNAKGVTNTVFSQTVMTCDHLFFYIKKCNIH